MSRINLKKKIIIGTANFTQTYGIVPTNISLKEIKKILNLAKKNKIYKIDTAEAYLKNSNIFKKIDKTFEFSTKMIVDTRWVSLEFCQQKLQHHIKSFPSNQIETLYFHNSEILLTKKGDKIFKNLELLKEKKLFQKIGISIYETKYLKKLILNYNFDIVQCPYNIFDNRILTSGWFDRLKIQGKEIHARSIFLQGLLVNPVFYEKKYFKKWKKIIFEWFEYLKNQNISPIDYCMSDLLEHNFDKIIIGINNYKNFNEIINFKKINKNKMINFKINDTKLIDPRNWK